MNRIQFFSRYPFILIFGNRITSIKKLYGLLASLAIVSILLIEIWLQNVPAISDVYYRIGQIYLKICYSFFSAFIFYILIVHLPKERRKVKLYSYIKTKIGNNRNEIGNIIVDISKSGGGTGEIDWHNVTEDEIKTILIEMKFNEENHWINYFNEKSKIIKNQINDIIIWGDVIDSEVLKYLTFIEKDLMIIGSAKDELIILLFFRNYIFLLYQDSEKLSEVFFKKYGRFDLEHYLIEDGNRMEQNVGTSFPY